MEATNGEIQGEFVLINRYGTRMLVTTKDQPCLKRHSRFHLNLEILDI